MAIHEVYETVAQTFVKNCPLPLPILLGHHSAIPRKVSDGHPKTFKVSIHCQETKELAMPFAYDTTCHYPVSQPGMVLLKQLKVGLSPPSVQALQSPILGGGPIVFFEAGCTECFRTLPKMWHLSLPVSYQFLQKSQTIPNLFCGS